MSKYNKDDFIDVKFKANGFTRFGRCVGKYLCVAYASQGHYENYKVFVVSTGKALTGKIADFDTAVDIAKAYIYLYRDQIFLHGDIEWADRNLPELCQYTIPNGIMWATVWNRLAEMDITSLDTIKQMMFVSGRRQKG